MAGGEGGGSKEERKLVARMQILTRGYGALGTVFVIQFLPRFSLMTLETFVGLFLSSENSVKRPTLEEWHVDGPDQSRTGVPFVCRSLRAVLVN